MNGVVDIGEKNDLAETLKQLNDDSFNKEKQSAIDMRSRLGAIEIPAIMEIDALTSMGVLPIVCGSLTHQKKRLAVSLYGKGRDEIVAIAQGAQEQQQGEGFVKKRSLFGLLKKNQPPQ